MPSPALLAALVKRSVALALPFGRAYANANMTSKVKITRPLLPVLNPVTGGLEMPDESTVYEGPAHIYTVSGPVTMQLGEEPQYYSTTYCSIPQELESGQKLPMVDDVVEVMDSADANLVARSFRVMDVSGGGVLPVATRMEIVGIQPSRQWS